MGVVYKAKDTQLEDRNVAIKEMKQDANASQEEIDKAVKLFKREAAILGSLNHPDLPHVYTSFEEAGKYYLVMDYIEGETLFHKIRRSSLTVEKVLNYAIQLCDILTYLHNQHPQVIFRDLKPSNIIIDPNDRVFLIDFGIARYFKPGQAEDTILIGTEGYIDPEISQIKQTNPCSDIYSLGATLHHCLTGQKPNYAHNHYQFPDISAYNSSVPQSLDDLILWMVEPQARRRPQSALRVKQELLQIQKSFKTFDAEATFGYDDRTVADPPNTPTEEIPLWQSLTDFFNSLLVSGTRMYRAFTGIALPFTGKLARGMQTLGKLLWETLVWLFQVLYRLAQITTVLLISPGWRQRLGTQITRTWKSTALALQYVRQKGRSFSLSGYSPVWRPRFLALLGLLLAITIGACLYLAQAFSGSYYAIGLSLSLLLLFVLFVAGNTINERVPRRILGATSIFALLFFAGFVLALIAGSSTAAGKPSIPQQPLMLNDLLIWGLITLALLAIASGFFLSMFQVYEQPAWYYWIDRLTLFAIAGTIILLQWLFGIKESIPLLTGIYTQPLGAPPISMNQVICAILLVVFALPLILRSKERFTVADRWLFFITVLPYLFLQWNFGPQEIQQQFPHTTLTSAILINVVFCFLALAGVLFIRRRESDGLNLLDRVIVLGLAMLVAWLQAFLGHANHVKIIPLSTSLSHFTFYHYLLIILIVGGVLLLFRLKATISELDRVIFFAAALSCAVIEFAFGQQQQQYLTQLSLSNGPSPINELAMSYVHMIAAGLLVLLVVADFLISVSRPRTSSLFDGSDSRTHLLLRLDRFIILGTTIESTVLLLSFTWQTQLLPYLGQPDLLFNQLIPLSCLIMTALLLLSLGLAFFRLSRPLERKDRFILLICNFACLLLLPASSDVQHLPLLIAGIQQTGSSWLQQTTLNDLIIGGSLGASLVSLLWLWRPFKAADRLILSALFLSAAGLAWLQSSLSQHILLALALILLLSGQLIALQIERIRIGTRVI